MRYELQYAVYHAHESGIAAAMEHHHEKTSHVEAPVHRHESVQDGHPHEHHARATAEGMDQGGHDKHAGHSPEMFRNRFFVSLVLTLPILCKP